MQLVEGLVQEGDLIPIGLRETAGFIVQGADRRLNLIRTKLLLAQGSGQDLLSLSALTAIPQTAILLLQGDELALLCGTRGASRIVQEEQGQESPSLRILGDQVVQQARQANGFGAQIVAHQLGAGSGRVALIEDQVEDSQDGVQPFGPEARRRDLVGDARNLDLALGAHQALRHGGFAQQEGLGDLAGGQTAEGVERQSDPRILCDGRVAAGEDQAQSFVRDHFILCLLLILMFQTLEDFRWQATLHLCVPRAPAIDGSAPSGVQQPGFGLFRNSVRGPAL